MPLTSISASFAVPRADLEEDRWGARGNSRNLCVMEDGAVPGNAPRRLRILCAEDHAMVADVVVRLLVRAGHVAELATNGLVAWQRLSHAPESFDVLLTDHHMPHMDGLELVRRLRTIPFAGRIIVHSNALSESDLEAYRALSVDLIVPKTTGADDLLRAVEVVSRRDY